MSPATAGRELLAAVERSAFGRFVYRLLDLLERALARVNG